MVSVLRTTLVTLMACAIWLALTAAWAAEENDNTISGSDEAFERIRIEKGQASEGVSVEEAISKFFGPDAVVDEGTYPPSEIWEHDGDLRRVKPEQVSYFGRLYGKYSSDDVSGVKKWEKELEMSFSYKQWDALFRISDVNTFSYVNDPFRLQKASLRYKGDDVKVTLGSFGALFGRGLALNMYEDRTLQFDNELEGIKVEVSGGDVETTALWGTYKLRSQLRNSEVTAARTQVSIGESVSVGAHGVQLKFPDANYTPNNNYVLDYKIIGGDLTWLPKNGLVYAEMARLNRNQLDLSSNFWDREGREGKAFYANAAYYGNGYTLSGEYKDYQGMNHPFSVLPPLRRYREKATADPNDDKGYTFELAWNPFENGSMFNFDYGQGNSHDTHRPFTEFSAIYTSPSKGKTSWIGEYWNVNVEGDYHRVARLTLNRSFDEDWSGSTFLERERLSADYFKAHFDHIVEAEIAYQSKFNAIFTWETTAAETTAEQRSSWKLWEFRWRPTEESEINLAKGSRREGFVCSGGVCRLEPAFEGWRVDYLLRF